MRRGKQPPPMPWLVVFDLDGTLIDSSEDLCASVNAMLVHLGRPTLDQGLITTFIGDGASALVRRALEATETTEPDPGGPNTDAVFDRAFAFFLDFYREHKLDTTRVYPGVMESLHLVRARHPDLPMAVLTNKPVNPSREICEALGLAPFFFANYGGNSFATKKPDPEGLLKLMAQAGAHWASQGCDPRQLQPSGVVMIGDSPADVLTARACGARSIGCRYGLAPEALAAAEPDVSVGSAFEWPEAVDAWQN